MSLDHTRQMRVVPDEHMWLRKLAGIARRILQWQSVTILKEARKWRR